MSELHQGNRGRVLPPPASERITISPYFAHLACDADLRTTTATYRQLAAELNIQHTPVRRTREYQTSSS